MKVKSSLITIELYPDEIDKLRRITKENDPHEALEVLTTCMAHELLDVTVRNVEYVIKRIRV